jgi:hypothetical protein
MTLRGDTGTKSKLLARENKTCEKIPAEKQGQNSQCLEPKWYDFTPG